LILDFEAFALSTIEANQEIINYLQEYHSNDYKYTNKIGEGGDNSLNADLLFEDIFKAYLLGYADIYSEESGEIKSSLSNEYQIILDPLDGSDNFLSQIPYYGSSVAVRYRDKTVFGAVCNFASKSIIIRYDECYYQYNLVTNQKLDITTTQKANIGIFERAYAYPKIVEKLHSQNLKFRGYGAIALSLSYAHSVNYLLFMGKARDFDVEAGLYISKDLNIYKDDRFILVSRDKEIFDNILSLI
jgi:myo-inositol-1(or 4)-monophosphatase